MEIHQSFAKTNIAHGITSIQRRCSIKILYILYLHNLYKMVGLMEYTKQTANAFYFIFHCKYVILLAEYYVAHINITEINYKNSKLPL